MNSRTVTALLLLLGMAAATDLGQPTVFAGLQVTPSVSNYWESVALFADIVISLGEDFSGTVFAPNNKAWQSMKQLLHESGVPMTTDRLKQIILYSIVPGPPAPYSALNDGQIFVTDLGAKTLTAKYNAGVLSIKGTGTSAQIVTRDLTVGPAQYAVIHVMDTVLLPFDIKATVQANSLAQAAASSGSQGGATPTSDGSSTPASSGSQGTPSTTGSGSSSPASSGSQGTVQQASILDDINNAVNSAVDAVTGATNSAANAVQTAVNASQNAVNTTQQTAAAAAAGVSAGAAAVAGTAAGVAQGADDIVTGAVNNITSGVNGAVSGVTGGTTPGSAASGPASGPAGSDIYCPLVYAPVCGKDGKTYGNDCQLRAAGVELASEGECGAPSGMGGPGTMPLAAAPAPGPMVDMLESAAAGTTVPAGVPLVSGAASLGSAAALAAAVLAAALLL